MRTRVCAAALLFAACPVLAQEAMPTSAAAEQSVLETRTNEAVEVFHGKLAADQVFAPVFLTAVSEAQLQAMTQQMAGLYGALIGVDAIEPRDAYSAAVKFRFEKAIGNGEVVLDPAEPNKIVGLRIMSFDALDDDVAKIRADLEALPGDVGVLYTTLGEDDEPVLAMNADQQFAIGSTFKLYVLSALARSIENGERQWSDVIALDRKSFPSGRLQDWPDDAPLTLHTLATLMISISDNTATDLLMRELGRDMVEAELHSIGHSDPDRTLPFLTTFEMFALKGSPGNMAKYIAADVATKRFILADLEDDVGGDRDKITPPRFIEPTSIDTVEWFASGEDLANVARRLAEIEDPVARSIMAVQPSLPQSTVDGWQYVGYKGGSEPGVLNLTWLLQDKGGEWHLLTMSWNNPEANLDHQALEALALRLLPFAN